MSFRRDLVTEGMDLIIFWWILAKVEIHFSDKPQIHPTYLTTRADWQIFIWLDFADYRQILIYVLFFAN